MIALYSRDPVAQLILTRTTEETIIQGTRSCMPDFKSNNDFFYQSINMLSDVGSFEIKTIDIGLLKS